MTREHKLALILGFSVVLVVGVLISDHFSDATVAELEDLTADSGDVATQRPIARTHATQAPAGDGVIPGGFSIDGEQESTVAILDRPAFQSSREALLSEIQKTWQMTQNAQPAAELDRTPPSSSTANKPVEQFKPQEETRQPIHTLSQLLRPEEQLPEPTITAPRTAARDAALDRNAPSKKHRVEEDESLWSIAEQHYGDGALYTKLAAFNSDRVGDDHSINVGAVLRIPPRHVLTGDKPAPRRSAGTHSNAAGALRTYTVAEGDTLGDISMRLLGTSKRWGEIVELNGIKNPDVVPVGTRLKIPASR